MLSDQVYNLIQLIGVMLLMYSIGGLKVGSEERRTLDMIIGGIALFFIPLAGFGMSARLGTESKQLWIVCKILLLVLVGAWFALLKRQPDFERKLSLFFILAVGSADLGFFGKTLD